MINEMNHYMRFSFIKQRYADFLTNTEKRYGRPPTATDGVPVSVLLVNELLSESFLCQLPGTAYGTFCLRQLPQMQILQRWFVCK